MIVLHIWKWLLVWLEVTLSWFLCELNLWSYISKKRNHYLKFSLFWQSYFIMLNDIQNVFFTLYITCRLLHFLFMHWFHAIHASYYQVPFGPLDRHMGISDKSSVCETCNKQVADCVGHFGHMKLALPVFHIGYGS